MTKRKTFMKPGLTLLTRGVIYAMVIAVVAICAILLPELAREEAVGKVNPPSAFPFLIGAWILVIPILLALYQTHLLLNYIENNTAFSHLAVKALQNIKICMIMFSALIVVGAITVIILARIADPHEDVAPIVTIGFIVTFVSSIIATFVAVLQTLLKEAIHMKTENDLTV